MNNIEYFYIEIKAKPEDDKTHNVIISKDSVPSFQRMTDKEYAEWVFGIYIAYCNAKEYYHYALRTFRKIHGELTFHGLVSEYFSDCAYPFWYDTYYDYKVFANSLPFNPQTKALNEMPIKKGNGVETNV